MNISTLLADPKVRDAYTALDTRRAPVQLADDYLQAKLSGRAAECKALEYHIRDLARVHFHRAGVLDMLNSMERHKKRRPMGKGAPKMLKDIAGEIRQQFATGDFWALDDGRVKFKIGGLTLTCKGQPGAVELMACKYERGLPAGFGNGRAKR